MKLSIIIPVFNEKDTILQILDKIEKVELGSIQKEVILVDDGSTDGTRDILKRISDHKIIFHETNQGKGSAIRTGLKYATGNMIIIQDADLEYNPKEISNLIKPIIEGKSKVVYGSRMVKKLRIFGKDKTPLLLHFIGNRLLTCLTNLLCGTNLTDMETCYKLISKDVMDQIKLKSKRFDFEPEVTTKIAKKGYKIHEVPIGFNPRDWGQGKKITKLDGLKALYYLIKYRFFD